MLIAEVCNISVEYWSVLRLSGAYQEINYALDQEQLPDTSQGKKDVPVLFNESLFHKRFLTRSPQISKVRITIRHVRLTSFWHKGWMEFRRHISFLIVHSQIVSHQESLNHKLKKFGRRYLTKWYGVNSAGSGIWICIVYCWSITAFSRFGMFLARIEIWKTQNWTQRIIFVNEVEKVTSLMTRFLDGARTLWTWDYCYQHAYAYSSYRTHPWFCPFYSFWCYAFEQIISMSAIICRHSCRSMKVEVVHTLKN